MSGPNIVHCPVLDCKYNTHPVKADFAQTQRHIWKHGYGNLLKTAKSLKLIEKYARPKGEELVEILANRSLIRSDQDE